MNRSYKEQYKQIKKHHLDTRLPDIPVTGRSAAYYNAVLFPDYAEQSLRKALKNIVYYDVGGGINHIYDKSLIRKYNVGKSLDIESVPKHKDYVKASIFNTKLKGDSVDLITINNLLYFHLFKKSQVKRALKEMHRVLRQGGEVRVFPVFYGNYYMGNEELFDYINKRFCVKVLKPKSVPNECPAFYIDDEIIKCTKGVDKLEQQILTRLKSRVVIFRKS